MGYTNYHTHCFLCDGQGHPDEYVKAALSKHLDVLGFSSHAPVPFDTSWTMDEVRLKTYLDLVENLKNKTEYPLIKKGLEVDYISGHMGPYEKRWHEMGLDYIIGSVHFIGLFGSAETHHWTVDFSPQELEKGIQDDFGGSGQKMVEHYYMAVAQMALAGGFDIVGHFDLVKKNNAAGKFFDESSPWYKSACTQALKVIADKDLLMEVNTGGISRGYTRDFYPSRDILKTCHQLGIRIVLNSDAHHPSSIVSSFPEALKMLYEIGYRHIWRLGRKDWEAVKISI